MESLSNHLQIFSDALQVSTTILDLIYDLFFSAVLQMRITVALQHRMGEKSGLFIGLKEFNIFSEV